MVQDGIQEPQKFLFCAYLNSLDEVPERIPILRWEWVEHSCREGKLVPINQYPAFKTRITYPSDYVSPSNEPQDVRTTSETAAKDAIETRIQHKRDPEDSNDSDDEQTRCVLSRLPLCVPPLTPTLTP